MERVQALVIPATSEFDTSLPGNSNAGHSYGKDLTVADKWALIEYIKTLYPRWDESKDERTVVPVPGAPHDLLDPRRILRGRVVYVEMQCGQCHGIDG